MCNYADVCVRAHVITGGAVCTDVHGHDGLHSIDPELEAQTEALRASEAKEASQVRALALALATVA